MQIITQTLGKRLGDLFNQVYSSAKWVTSYFTGLYED